MDQGTIATLDELLALKSAVQKKRHPAKSTALQIGHRRTQLRGRGMDFAEVRNYQAGDEIRHMEWRATARTGRPHIKLYEEERERPVLLVVDFNPSMHFGTQGAFNSVIAAKLAAMLAWIAMTEGDRVGRFLFSGDQHDAHLPEGHHKGVLPLIKNLSQYTEHLHQAPDVAPAQLNDILIPLKRVLKPGTLLLLISDFYTLNEASEPLLSRIKKHNDIIAYHVADPLELTAPKPGLYPISNGQQTSYLDLRRKKARMDYINTLNTRQIAIKSCFQRLNTSYYPVTASTDWINLAHHSFPRSQHA